MVYQLNCFLSEANTETETPAEGQGLVENALERGDETKIQEITDQEEPGLWEETFKSHHESKPYGPVSVGVDISFPGAKHVYGIPEHADTFALRQTK